MAQRPSSIGILANQMREFDSVKDFFTSGKCRLGDGFSVASCSSPFSLFIAAALADSAGDVR